MEKQINKISKSKQNKETMKAKWEVIDMNFVPNGRILDDDLKLLRSKINELKRNLQKKFEIIIKETASNTPYVLSISDGKTKIVLCRYKSSNFEKELDIIHRNQTLRRVWSRKKK